MAGSALTAFAPCGAFRLSSRPTYAEKIYRQMVEQQRPKGTDGAFDSSWNSYNSCRLYAVAMALQTAKLQLQHAANQRDPRYVTEKLEELEKDYQLIPLPSATTLDRRTALQLAMARRSGNTLAAITAGLVQITGGCSVVVEDDPAVLIGQTTLRSFDNFKPGIGHKVVQLTAAIMTTGAQTVPIAVAGGTGEQLKTGERLTVDVDCNGRAEVVTVTAATPTTLTATFANGHDSGAWCTTQQWPAWVGHKRHYIIMLWEPDQLSDAATILAINNFMDHATRASSTWTITLDDDGHSDAFTIESSRIDQNTIEAIAD